MRILTQKSPANHSHGRSNCIGDDILDESYEGWMQVSEPFTPCLGIRGAELGGVYYHSYCVEDKNS